MRIRVDGPVPLSASVLWRSLRAFYEQRGREAFTSGVVPWRITSSPLTAASWAEAAAAFASERPGRLQVIELGGGTGRLAFHLLRALEARGLDFHYLFTDAASSMVAAAAAHPQLLPWVQQGRLSFRQLDALAPGGLEVGEGPVVLVANYLFDSLPHDAWQVEAGRATAQHVEVWSAGPDAALEQTDWKLVAAADRVEPALHGYGAHLGAGRFLWPTGALACLNAFAALLGRPHLWLIADKGPGTAGQVRGQDTAQLAKHGCISAMVNFDALRAWAGWRPFFAPASIQPRFGLYGLVQGTCAVTALRQAWEQTVAANTPLQALVLLEEVDTDEATLEELLRALAFTRFDPDSLLRISGRLRAQVSGQTPPPLVRALGAALDATWANHFVLDERVDLAFEIATVLHRAGQLSHAAGYYRRSALFAGPHAATYFNLALCLLDLGQVDTAREALESALTVDPAHARARALLTSTG